MTYYHMESYLTPSPTLSLATVHPHWTITQLSPSRKYIKAANIDTRQHNFKRPAAPTRTRRAASLPSVCKCLRWILLLYYSTALVFLLLLRRVYYCYEELLLLRLQHQLQHRPQLRE